MDPKTEERLTALAEEALAACLLKLSFASPGEWRLGEVRSFELPPGWTYPAGGRTAAVRVTVASSPSFTTALLFQPEELGHLASCFADERLPAPARDAGVTVLEIGNIVLNALINALLKALKKSAIPSVPERLPGPGALPEGLPAGETLLAVSLTVAAVRGGRTAETEIAALLPPALAAQL